MKYFTYEEFDSPDVQGSGQMMNEKILRMIDAVRAAYGKPIHINSGYRTPKHNEAVGGVESSSHLQGLAINIDCDTYYDWKILFPGEEVPVNKSLFEYQGELKYNDDSRLQMLLHFR